MFSLLQQSPYFHKQEHHQKSNYQANNTKNNTITIQKTRNNPDTTQIKKDNKHKKKSQMALFFMALKWL